MIGVLFISFVIGFVFKVVDIVNRIKFLCRVLCILRYRVKLRLVFSECLWNLLKIMVFIFVNFGLVCSICVRMFLVMILMWVVFEVLVFF